MTDDRLTTEWRNNYLIQGVEKMYTQLCPKTRCERTLEKTKVRPQVHTKSFTVYEDLVCVTILLSTILTCLQDTL